MTNTWSTFIAHIKKEKLMSMSNIVVMTITFLLLGIFINVVVFSQTALRYLEQQAQITIFFKDAATSDKILSYKEDLEKNSKIQEVKYVSKEDALRIFKEMNKDEPILLDSVSASILPASLEVRAKNIAELKSLTEEFKKLEGVEEVRFFEDIVQKFTLWSRVIYIVSFFLVALFMAISYSVIIAAIRTSINTRGSELEIMKLVGASDDYVKKPFIYQGEFYGVFASSLAAVVILIIDFSIDKMSIFSKGLTLGFIPVYINTTLFSVLLAILLIGSGFLLGFVGSTSAVKKYLKY